MIATIKVQVINGFATGSKNNDSVFVTLSNLSTRALTPIPTIGIGQPAAPGKFSDPIYHSLEWIGDGVARMIGVVQMMDGIVPALTQPLQDQMVKIINISERTSMLNRNDYENN